MRSKMLTTISGCILFSVVDDFSSSSISKRLSCFATSLWVGFRVLNFLSIFSLTQKWLQPKAEQFAKIQFLNDKIHQNTDFAKWLFLYIVYVICTIRPVYNCSAFGSSYLCVSFSLERKSERIERKLKTQNLVWHYRQ